MDVKCIECAENSYPVNHTDYFLCFEQSSLKSLGFVDSSIDLNCLKYNN